MLCSWRLRWRWIRQPRLFTPAFLDGLTACGVTEHYGVGAVQLAVEMALDQVATAQAGQRAVLFMRSLALRHEEVGRKLETSQEVP